MEKHSKLINFINHFIPLKADWSFSSFIWKLEKKNNPENPVNPV
jgi:hypothetical protein